MRKYYLPCVIWIKEPKNQRILEKVEKEIIERYRKNKKILEEGKLVFSEKEKVKQFVKLFYKHAIYAFMENKLRLLGEKLSKSQVVEFFANTLINYVNETKYYILGLENEEEYKKLRDIVGPTFPEEARKVAPNSIRAFSEDTLEKSLKGNRMLLNGVHCSEDYFEGIKDLIIITWYVHNLNSFEEIIEYVNKLLRKE